MHTRGKEIGTHGVPEANGQNKYTESENDDGDPTDCRSESKEAMEVVEWWRGIVDICIFIRGYCGSSG